MRKYISVAAFVITILLFACSNGKESASSIAKKWCELNGKEYRASSDEERNKARAARESFEKDLIAKYKSDEAFRIEVEAEVEKCEDASEGR